MRRAWVLENVNCRRRSRQIVTEQICGCPEYCQDSLQANCARATALRTIRPSQAQLSIMPSMHACSRRLTSDDLTKGSQRKQAVQCVFASGRHVPRAHWQPLRSPDPPMVPDLDLTVMGLNGFPEARDVLSGPARILYSCACCDDNSGVGSVILQLFQGRIGPRNSTQTQCLSRGRRVCDCYEL